ncbi:MAG: DUF2829 domain-containing protein [Macromonas sp.]
MQTYIGTKIIQAEPLAKNYGPPETHGQSGYKVVYPDGYTSWSPAAAFEEAYRPCDAMTFGLAIEALKKGKRVARAGWNGKNMFLFLIQGSNDIAYLHGCGFGEYQGEPTFRDAIFMRTVDNQIVPWTASQTDCLAEDWQIVE